MENLKFVVYWMNGEFYAEISFSAYMNGAMDSSPEEFNDYIAMICGL